MNNLLIKKQNFLDIENEKPRIKHKKQLIIEKTIKVYESLKEYYKDGIKVSIYYEDMFDNIEKQSLKRLKDFFEDAKTFNK